MLMSGQQYYDNYVLEIRMLDFLRKINENEV